jgi:gliding motility-associated-like protein
VIDVNGCPGSYTAYGLITVYPDPVAGFDFGPQPTTTLAPEITFTPDCQLCASCVYYINNDSDAVITNNCTGFTYSFPDTGTYVVTQEVYTQYGCMATITHTVRIEPAFVLYAPNAFTPNGDGLNEVFLPQGIGIDPENYELFIFDRWGNLLFKTQDMHEGWDGCVWTNKKLVQEDTYIWKVVVKDIMDVKHIYNGHVSVIK